jgi:hypothetical protein
VPTQNLIIPPLPTGLTARDIRAVHPTVAVAADPDTEPVVQTPPHRAIARPRVVTLVQGDHAQGGTTRSSRRADVATRRPRTRGTGIANGKHLPLLVEPGGAS